MATPAEQAKLIAKAPEVFKGWDHLKGSLSVALPASLRNANRIASAVMRLR